MNWSEIINQTIIVSCLTLLYAGIKKDTVTPLDTIAIGILVGIASFALEAGHL